MEEVEWLIERLGEARCAGCGLRYTKGAVRGIGYENDSWFVYVTCLGCGTQGVGVAMARGGGEPAAAISTKVTTPPLTSDDVLDAHEHLVTYRGDIHGLFPTGARQGVG